MPERKPKKVEETPVSELLDRIFAETVRVSRLTWDQRRAELPPGQFMPHFIVVEGGSIPTSNEAARDIKKLSDMLRKGEYAFTSDPEQFYRDASSAVGELLLELRNTQQSEIGWLERAAKRFQEILKARVDLGRKTMTEIVPCDVFDEDQNVGPFSIGPVKFMPRMAWLDSLPRSRRVDYVREVWTKKKSIGDFEALNKSTSAQEKVVIIGAMDVLRHIGSRPWVATVTLHDHDPVRAHANGPLLVELALDFLSLFMGQNNGQRLSHPGISGPLTQTSVAFDPEDRIYTGWRFNKRGVGAPPGTANELLTSQAGIIADAGAILSRYLSGAEIGAIPPLVERWVGALHWYGMALRDTNDFAALCDYGDVIDVLTKSGGANEKMVEYLAVALDISERRNPTELAKLNGMVKRVYSEGRSQLRHGEKIGLMRDFSAAIAEGNYLAQISLLAVARPLAEVVRADHSMLSLDPSHERRAFLAFIERWNDERRDAEAATSPK